MKKIYLSLALTGFAFTGLYAQRQAANLNQVGLAKKIIRTGEKPVVPVTEKITYWSEDFDIGTTGPAPTTGGSYTTPNGTWTTGGTNGADWKHSFYTTSGEWSTNTEPFASTTAANGFLLFDADSINFAVSGGNQSLYAGYTGELISPTIDLSTATSAMVTFEQNFRFCCVATHIMTLSVSLDNGATWLPTTYDCSFAMGANDQYYPNNGDSFDATVNISGIGAGLFVNTVKLKWTWDGVASGNSHYFWNIDDIEIVDWPADDIQVLSSWISGDQNAGTEYGRTPEDQQDANYLVGGQVYNFGSADQTNVMWDADFTLFSTNATDALLESDSTVIFENTLTPGLGVGVYTGDYLAVSDQETMGAYFGNNDGMREFEITNPTTTTTPMTSVYSQDGIDLYTNSTLSSLGTNSFTGGEDGLVAASYYHIKSTALVSGIRVMLANGTLAGAEVYGSIKDTSLFWAGDMTSMFVTDASPLAITVNATDITNGYKDLLFLAPITLNPGVYYAAIEMYSSGNTFDIRILDDETVAQPFDASAIYIPGDQSYTNGTALGIRMLMGDQWGAGVDENTLTGVSIFPNPSEGLVNITVDNSTTNSVVVTDMLGKVVLTKEISSDATLNLSAVGTGVYLVEVSNATGSMVERVVIK